MSTGIPLADALRRQDTLCAGTLRVSRQGVPLAVKNAKLARNEMVFRRRDNLLAMKWHDKKVVAFLSSAHTAQMVDGKHLDSNGKQIE